MAIIEERLFSTTGRLMLRTKTPRVTDLRQYRQCLGARVTSMSLHRYDGYRGICFLLNDGRMLVVILGRDTRL